MPDVMDHGDRRKFKRFPFSTSDEVFGLVSLTESDPHTRQYRIGDIGAGGLKLIIRRKDLPNITIGSTFVLNKITGQDQLGFLSAQRMEVVWLLDELIFDHVLIGCRFSTISDEEQKRIVQFVESKMRQQ